MVVSYVLVQHSFNCTQEPEQLTLYVRNCYFLYAINLCKDTSLEPKEIKISVTSVINSKLRVSHIYVTQQHWYRLSSFDYEVHFVLPHN